MNTVVTHELKTWPEYFQAIKLGIKTFECRKNDRGFRVCDELHLKEYYPQTGEYSGRELFASISYILDKHDGLKDGYVIMSLEDTNDGLPF